MFRKLRNRFLFMHMGVVILLIFIFFFGILIINYQGIESRSISMLEMEIQPKPLMRMGRTSRLIPSFSVEISEKGDVLRVMSAFNMEDSFYKGIAKEAVMQKKETGKVLFEGAHFRYKLVDNSIVFLEITEDIDTLYSMAISFLWIMLPTIGLIFIISLFFANKSIKPIEETFNRQKEFIGDASHELKTPLATISTNTDVLIDTANSEQMKWLSYIKSETLRMESLTNSLLYLTKMDYNDKKSNFLPVNLSDTVENVLMPLEAVFFEKKVKSDINITPDLIINGDLEQIKRLIGILVDNAIKYSNGKISINLIKEQNEVHLSVFNTGAGISNENIERIWDRFYRVDKSREHTGGFGLGLSIAKAIVSEHNGKIYVESSEGEWTRFTVTFQLK